MINEQCKNIKIICFFFKWQKHNYTIVFVGKNKLYMHSENMVNCSFFFFLVMLYLHHDSNDNMTPQPGYSFYFIFY